MTAPAPFTLTEEQRAELEQLVRQARAIAAPIGAMCALWDPIFDAAAILAGRPTLLRRADPAEVYALVRFDLLRATR